MTFRDRQLLRLRELLEQLAELHDQLAWCQDENAIEYLADCMLRDLEQCRRVVQSLKSPSQALLAN